MSLGRSAAGTLTEHRVDFTEEKGRRSPGRRGLHVSSAADADTWKQVNVTK